MAVLVSSQTAPRVKQCVGGADRTHQVAVVDALPIEVGKNAAQRTGLIIACAADTQELADEHVVVCGRRKTVGTCQPSFQSIMIVAGNVRAFASTSHELRQGLYIFGGRAPSDVASERNRPSEAAPGQDDKGGDHECRIHGSPAPPLAQDDAAE